MAKQAPKLAPTDPKASENRDQNDPNANTLPEQVPVATDTVKVKFLRSHPNLAYAPGEVADLPKELHDKYLADGPFFEAVAVTAPAE